MPAHEPPLRMIRFLAQTGFISRKTWQEFFAPYAKECWRQRAWKNLLAQEYCLPHPEKHLSNVYVLNRHHPMVRQAVQGAIVSPQRATYFEHDETLYRGILRAESSGVIARWMSEAELKTAKNSAYRIETTDGSSKFPDALVFPAWISNAKSVAVECELTVKSALRYSRIMAAYARMQDVGTILFVTDHPAVERQVTAAMTKHRYGRGTPEVVFHSVEDWLLRSKELLMALYQSRTAAVQPESA